MKMNKKNHPQWVVKHKRTGTELRFINGRYYLYEYKTVYDKENKKPKKITGRILGSITEKDGFVASSKTALKQRAIDSFDSIVCKEYGVAYLVCNLLKEYSIRLKQLFDEEWKNIVAIAYGRFLYRCPLKSMPFRLASSYLPELLEIKAFNEKQTSTLLNRLGGQSEKRIQYMKSFILPQDHVLMDATNVPSFSQHIPLAKTGYSNQMNFDPQFNLMYLYSAANKMPVYYKLLPGNIREVKAFKNMLIEAGLENAVVVADKGFYSKENVKLLQLGGLKFILPLKRDSSLIDYSAIKENKFKEGQASFFLHEKKPVWFKTYNLEDQLSLHLYLDEPLRVKEENDYLIRIETHPETHTIRGYYQRKDRFGTIALLTNLKTNETDVYQTYKGRMAIEVLFDGMKNILDADHTYMQNEQTLQGWMFINHITLQWYQRLYIELKEKDLLKKYSVNDYIQLLSDIKKVKINDKWYMNEFTNHTRKLLKKLNLEI